MNNVLKAYKNADNKGKQLLRDFYGDNIGAADITDFVKSFEDACEILGISTDLPDVSMLPEKDGKSIVAYYKLTVIIRALNEGWEPIYKDGGCNNKYWAWFDGCVLAQSSNATSTNGGVSCTLANIGASSTYAITASRLAFKDERLAKYCGITFEKLWAEYMVIEK